MPTFPLPLSSRRGRALARLFLAAALLLGGLSQAAASTLSGAWRINANGFAGEVALQQAPDGTLGGSVFGNPLTGFHAPGERSVVWLRGAPAQPDQAYVGTLGADGGSVSGRFYALTVGGGGGSPARNVFAFTAQRGAAAPGHPGVPAAAGPASVAGTLALTANNIPGALVLTQAADGTLGGSIYGDRIGGHYAAGTGTIAFLRYSGAQPVQLYVGTVGAQGIEGEFYALTVPAGGSAQRMRYAWRAQLPQAAAQQAAPPAQAQQAVSGLPGPQTAVAPPPPQAVAPPATSPALLGRQLPGRDVAGLPNPSTVPTPAPASPPAVLVQPLPPAQRLLTPGRGVELACGIEFARPCVEALNPMAVRVRWAARADADRYRVYRDSLMLEILDGNAREYIDSEPPTGAVTRYKVDAVRITGEQTFTVGTVSSGSAVRFEIGPDGTLRERKGGGAPVQNVTRPTFAVLETSQEQPVAVPTVEAVRDLSGTLASAEQGRVRLNWTPARHASGHLILRNGAPLAEVGAVGTFDDLNVPAGAHRYAVRAFFRPGPKRPDLNAAASNEVVVSVPAPPPMLVGTGISDITGPVAEVGMMGYASSDQKATGLHMRLYARAFIFASPVSNRRVVFVTADLGQLFSSVKQGVIRDLQKRFGALYDDRNVMIAATHTHAGPGGYAHHALFNFTTFGHVRQNYEAIVDGIVESIQRAHDSLAPAEVSHASGNLGFLSSDRQHANVQRSDDAFRRNPEYGRDQDINPTMDVFRITRGGRPVGAVSWYATHNNSLTKHNTLICSDHKGLAAYQFEKRMGSVMPWHNPGGFVAAFPNSDEGDMSPNVWRDWNSEAHTAAQFIRMATIANRQFTAAVALYEGSGHTSLRPDIDFRHTFVEMPGFVVRSPTRGSRGNQLCNAAYGFSFGAGAEDGRSGTPILEEGMREDSPLTAVARASLYAIGAAIVPAPLLPAYRAAMGAGALIADNSCHFPKPVLIPSGFLGWTARILPFQLFRIGSIAIVGVPGEMTVQAGRRLRAEVLAKLEPLGVNHVIITGLANEYSGYITTPEEYDAQHYEGASTVFGRLTFDAYRQIFGDLSAAMAAGQAVPPGPTPPDLSGGPIGTGNIELQTGVAFDDKRVFERFGQVLQEPKRTGNSYSAIFRAGHPKNDLRRNASYFYIERQIGNSWQIVATDADPETRLIWRRDTAPDCLACSTVEVQWDLTARDLPSKPVPGYYRIRLLGAWKQGLHAPIGTGMPPDSINTYEAVTRPFFVQ